MDTYIPINYINKKYIIIFNMMISTFLMSSFALFTYKVQFPFCTSRNVHSCTSLLGWVVENVSSIMCCAMLGEPFLQFINVFV